MSTVGCSGSRSIAIACLSSPAIILAPSWRRFLQGLVSLDSKKHGQHNRTSLASYLFPNANLTRQARARLFTLRYWWLPSLAKRAQSNVYQYLVKRQARKPGQRYPFVVSNPSGRTPTFWRRRYVNHGPGGRKKAKMAYTGQPAGNGYGESSASNGNPGADLGSFGDGGLGSFSNFEGGSFNPASEADLDAARAEAEKMEAWWKSQENS